MTGSADVRVVTERVVEVSVGDWVAVAGSAADGTAQIAAVLPRRVAFRRTPPGNARGAKVVAANIDTVFVCDALDGSLGLRHLERFLALAWHSGATPVVVITKVDAVSEQQVTDAVEAVRMVTGKADVVAVSSRTAEGLHALEPYLRPAQTIALVGLSGAGKSTLANLLAGAEVMATGEVRVDGSGRHTTTHRELVMLPRGGLLIDTPGMRALSLLGAGEGVEQAFSDIEMLAGECMHRDCSHAGEDGCAISAAVSGGRLQPGRLEAWFRLRTEMAPSKADDIRGDIAERKRRKAVKYEARRSGKNERRRTARD